MVVVLKFYWALGGKATRRPAGHQGRLPINDDFPFLSLAFHTFETTEFRLNSQWSQMPFPALPVYPSADSWYGLGWKKCSFQ